MKCRWIMIGLLLALPALAQMPGPGGPPMGGPMGGHMGGMAMGGMHRGGPGLMGEWWKNSDVVQQLKLTDVQRKQIEQNFLDSRLRLIDDNADVQKQELKLSALMSADQFNESQAVAQLDQVLTARTKLGKEYAMMLISMRRVLTPEQWKTLESLHHRAPRGGVRGGVTGRGPRGMGPAGPGPGGPGGPSQKSTPPAGPPPGDQL